MPRAMARLRAFTLIELLIVVAIIAILAAIAVPNFLEAQVRAKVSRAKTDMRTLATGLEAYAVDENCYPDVFSVLGLTTPIAYISGLLQDPFRPPRPDLGPPMDMFAKVYGYGAMPLGNGDRYIAQSNGPDTDIDAYLDPSGGTAFTPDVAALMFYPGYAPEMFDPARGFVPPLATASYLHIVYDPTNGTVSSGDIHRYSDHQAN